MGLCKAVARHWKQVSVAVAICGAVATGVAAENDMARIVAVDFTATALPATDADRLRTYTSSKAVVSYADGSQKRFPLQYKVLFKNTDKVGSNAGEAGRLYDVDGKPLVDNNGDPVISETPDGNSLLNVGGKLYLVTHWEYDWLLGNGEVAKMAEGWYSRMPMSMTLTHVEQNAATGELKAVDQRPIDFSSVNGLWIPCFASQTPWNTHLGSEEDYDLYHVEASGRGYKKAGRGLKALSEVYFNKRKQANPYHYGYITEVTVQADGGARVNKHFAMGRGTWEMAKIMPDQRTAYYGDDGNYVGMFMFVADKPADLSAGTLYAARWNQLSSENGGTATLSWVRLGHAGAAGLTKLIDDGIGFDDIFVSSDKPEEGLKAVRAGHAGVEYLKLKPGMEQAAAFLEPRRYAAYLGATTEFTKMEGVTVDARARNLYVAMSYIGKGMRRDVLGPVDHIRVGGIGAGGVYRVALKAGQFDTRGQPIDSDWVGVAMSIPPALHGRDIAVDEVGNRADPHKPANPDNLFFSDGMRTLFISEDSVNHVNNNVWAYNVDSNKLTRILSLASGSEASGLQVVENQGGHAYIMSNSQHQGDWLGSMPYTLRTRLIEAARQAYGVNAKQVLNYQLQADVGYISGMPGL